MQHSKSLVVQSRWILIDRENNLKDLQDHGIYFLQLIKTFFFMVQLIFSSFWMINHRSKDGSTLCSTQCTIIFYIPLPWFFFVEMSKLAHNIPCLVPLGDWCWNQMLLLSSSRSVSLQGISNTVLCIFTVWKIANFKCICRSTRSVK